MTRFVGEAKDVRQGRVKRFPTSKEMKKEMEIFKRTGRHPALEGNNDDNLPALPERDMNRPHVFLDIRHGNVDLGMAPIFHKLCRLPDWLGPQRANLLHL